MGSGHFIPNRLKDYIVGTERVKIYRIVTLVLSLVAVLITSSSQVVAETNIIKASKISVIDKALARKIAISYHHAILETNYEQGYIIADLSVDEIKSLLTLGLKIENATQWNKKYQQFVQTRNELIKAKGTQLTGIPGFECYPTVEETLQQGSDLSITYPQLTEWIDIGDSWRKTNSQPGYDLMVLKISNKNIVKNKPKLFIHSAMHAREYTPAALTLDFAKHLLANYAIDPDIQWIVDQHEVHILFHMNPDGRKVAETGELQRKNMNDNHCPSTVKTGVDLNRNFAYFWNTAVNGSSGLECSQVFRGISPESEPETQAVSNYIRSLFPDSRGPNEGDAAPTDTSGMHLDIHSYSQLVLWPYGHTETLSPNDQGFVALGNKLAWFNDYTPQQSIGLYPTDGTSDDVSYGELGIAAFTFELGTSFFQSCADYENTIKPDNIEALIYAAKASAAPYQLGSGAEVSQIELNGSSNGTSVTQGSTVNIVVTANAIRSKQASAGRVPSQVEYSIDTPIWDDSADIIILTNNDGSLTSGIEIFSGQIDTSSLSTGEHLLYTRAYINGGSYGVPTVSKITIAENNAPIPEFSSLCDGLNCTFDASESSDTDGTITNYLWDFNGEGSSTAQMTNFAFTQNGTKQVTLTITDNSNNQSVKTSELSVTAPLPIDDGISSGGGALFWLLTGLFLVCLLRSNLLSAISFRLRVK